MVSDPLGELIRRALRDAPFAMRQLAADSGLSYDVLRSWRSGRRRPSRQSAQRLAAGLERRGEQLMQLSRQLRDASDGASGAGEASGAGAAASGAEGRGAAPRSMAASGPRDAAGGSRDGEPGGERRVEGAPQSGDGGVREPGRADGPRFGSPPDSREA